MSLGDMGSVDLIKAFLQQAKEEVAEYRREVIAGRQSAALLPPRFPVKSPIEKKKDLKARAKKIRETIEGRRQGKLITAIEKRRDTANQFNNRNSELEVNVLADLAEKVKASDSPFEIFNKVLSAYPDVTLADEALEFLITTRILETHPEFETIKAASDWLEKQKPEELEDRFLRNIIDARIMLNVKHGREVIAGYHASEHARDVAKSLNTTPTNLRDMYRKITHEQPEFDTLFSDLSEKYPSFQDIVKVTGFFYHSIGKDLNSAGPSIEPGKLHALMREVKVLQAVMGVYKWWEKRGTPLLEKKFQKDDLEYPSQTMNFETLSKEFINLLSDRYPQTSKLIQSVARLQADKQATPIKKILALINVIEAYRDAVPQIDNIRIPGVKDRKPQFQDAIVTTLESLEEDLVNLEAALEEEDSKAA